MPIVLEKNEPIGQVPPVVEPNWETLGSKLIIRIA